MENEEIKKFIYYFGHRMKANQVKLLQLMADNIYGFRLIKHETDCEANSTKLHNTCIFTFEHENAKGEITIYI